MKIIFIVSLSLFFIETSWAGEDLRYPIMSADVWIESIHAAEADPPAEIFPEIKSVIDQATLQGQPTSYSLLNHLDYDPVQRNQGECGNCYVWASTALMEIAHDVNSTVFDRLSIQYFNSCQTDKFACCGGNLSKFATWYSRQGVAIPRDNTSAAYNDGDTLCEDEVSTVACSDISQTPHYVINSISSATIPTYNVTSSTAIANIKTLLNSNKGVLFGFALPNATAWDNFQDFWDCSGGETEKSLWSAIDSFCGRSFRVDSGAHVVVVYGYNDDDPNPANHYWMAINSWGTADGHRPNGVFRIPMHLDYDCKYPDPVEKLNYVAFKFSVLDVEFADKNPHQCIANADCADALFCNGVEMCVDEECVFGTVPCWENETCDEARDLCFCNMEWDLDGDCDIDKDDSTLLRLRQKDEKTYYKNLHKSQKTTIRAAMAFPESCGEGWDLNGDCFVDKADARILKLRQKDEKTALKIRHKTEKTEMKAALQ